MIGTVVLLLVYALVAVIGWRRGWWRLRPMGVVEPAARDDEWVVGNTEER